MNTEFLFYLFLGWSISSTLVNGSIFDNFRNWLLVFYPLFGKLLSCVRCSSFWIGVLLFWFLLSQKMFVIFPDKIPLWMNYFFLPFVQSGFSVVVESLVIYLVKDSFIKQGEKNK